MLCDCKSVSLQVFLTYLLTFLFSFFHVSSCFLLTLIPQMFGPYSDTSCLLLVFFIFQIGFSEITKTCTHVHRLPLKRLTRLKKKVIQSWREFYIRFPAANPSCQTLHVSRSSIFPAALLSVSTAFSAEMSHASFDKICCNPGDENRTIMLTSA